MSRSDSADVESAVSAEGLGDSLVGVVARLDDALLGPLAEAAARVLRDLDDAAVPTGLRALRGFRPHALAGPTRRSLLAAMLAYPEFGAAVRAAYADGVEAEWDPTHVAEEVAVAAREGPEALARLASELVACAPPGAEFALGICLATWNALRASAAEHAEAAEATAALARAEEGARRADAARRAEHAARATAESELREERATRRQAQSEARRTREEVSVTASEAAERAARDADTLREARRELADVHAALARSENAREDLERAGRPEVFTPVAPVASVLADVRRLEDEVVAIRRALELSVPPVPGAAPASGVGTPPNAPDAPDVADAPRPTRARTQARRAPVLVPKGLTADDPAALRSMAATPGLVVLVDGYNVAMDAYPEASAADQRARLTALLAGLHARVGCEITVVFDGADVGPLPPAHRPGVRVLFSAAGEEADDVIVRVAASLPRMTPVLVVSSDADVRRRSEHEGARVVTAPALLRVLRA